LAGFVGGMASPRSILRGYRLPDGGRLLAIALPTATGFSTDEDGGWRFDDGTSIEPRVFVRLDSKGVGVARYGGDLRTSALDDYFYVENVHFVEDGQLCSTMLEYGGPFGVFRSRMCGRDVVLTGLVRED
jgi:hypothetical protein